MIEQTKIREPLSVEFGERYVVNSVGEPVEVILTLDAFERLLKELRAWREKESLQREMDAWDLASDEALTEFEKALG